LGFGFCDLKFMVYGLGAWGLGFSALIGECECRPGTHSSDSACFNVAATSASVPSALAPSSSWTPWGSSARYRIGPGLEDIYMDG